MKKSRKLPIFKNDREAENFLDQDLSDYISAENFAPFQFEFRPKQKSVNLRISEELLNAVRAVAHRRGIPYQRYIRQTLEAALRPSKEPRSGKGRHRSGK
jgi:predicted DNA binding CopG/RHH family protein